MSGNFFLRRIALKDGNMVYNKTDKTILVEIVDETGGSCEMFVPVCYVDLDPEQLDDSAEKILGNLSTGTSQPSKKSNSTQNKNSSKLVEDNVNASNVPEEINDNSSNDSDSCDVDKNDEENTTSNTSGRSGWSTGQSRRLLQLYNEYVAKVGPLKKFKTKKHMFAKIALIISEEYEVHVDESQCSNRHKAIIRKYKLDQQNNRTSGASRKDLEFEEEIEVMKAADDSLQPEVRMGVGKIEHIHKKPKLDKKPEDVEKAKEKKEAATTAATAAASTSASGVSQAEKPQNVTDALLQISDTKEQKKDVRHREKLELLREILRS